MILKKLSHPRFINWMVVIIFSLILIQGIRGTVEDGQVESAEIPVLSEVYDGCFYRTNFGVECPTCGMSRSFYSFFDGHFEKAVGFNGLIVVILPLFVVLIINSIYFLCFNRYSPLILKVLYVLIALLIVLFVIQFVVFVKDMWAVFDRV